MSSFRAPSTPADADDDGPRRKMSVDFTRLRNLPSALSLRKQEPDTPPRSDAIPSSGTFSRLRAFSQSQRPSRSSMGSDHNDASTESRSTRRTSRLLDAFKPSKKLTPSFEVIRKPGNRSTSSFHPSSHQTSPNTEVPNPTDRAAVQPAPRISLSAPRSESSRSIAADASQPAHNGLATRSPYPPSTTTTRKSSSTHPISANTRKPSDPYLNLGSASNSRAQSPSPNANTDAANGSFSLHSFRNVRSSSDVSTADEFGVQPHSRVQSMISVDEYLTPGEELPEPRYPDSQDAIRAQSTSPAPSAKPASISAAKFRQASRQRSESGNVPTMDTIQAGSGFVRPPRSRTPSQDLAAMEAVLSKTHPSTKGTSDADRRKSTDLAQLRTTADNLAASSVNGDTQRRKRGVFIVVEGLDRAGKSTQVERLAEHLQAKSIKFPERTTAIGQMINSYLAQTSELDDQAIHLLFSANRWECVASINRTLDAGESIVCDRYAFSGIAYSVAKGLSYDWCRNPDVGLPLPDLTMFLDLDAQTAAARGGYGEERYEKLEFQAKVREAFSRVSQDVKSHGGRWVTIDASKTLDEVTDDIQKAVQRVTSSIDRVGVKLGKLFVSERPPNVRAGSSNELLPPTVVPNIKRSSMSSQDSGRKRLSLDQPRMAHTNGTFPAVRPSGSPLTYTGQLAAVRAAAAGTLSGFFGGSSTTVDQQTPSTHASDKQLPEADGPSPVNATRGQGFDSARVLASRPDAPGRRRTLIDVIGELEGQTQQSSAPWTEHRRSMSATAEPTSPTLQSNGEGFPSTFAQAARVRRSTDQGRVPQLPTIASGAAAPSAAPRRSSLTGQSGAGADSAASPVTATAAASSRGTAAQIERPVASPSGMRASSSSSVGNAIGADSTLVPPSSSASAAARASTLSPAARAASPAITTSSRSSLASPPLPTSPVPRPASVNPVVDHSSAAPSDAGLLSSHHLSQFNTQQTQAEMQEQYMRNYMAMMANPMMAHQAQYLMLQRHQQQYYGRAASAIGGVGAGANGVGQTGNGGGGPPLAAFMQPMAMRSTDAVGGGEREKGAGHTRTQSSGETASSKAQQPMLSMMMAAPPPASEKSGPFYPAPPGSQPGSGFYGQPTFYPNAGAQFAGMGWSQQQQQQQQQQAAMLAAGYGRPMYASTRSEIATPTTLRSQRSSDKGFRGQQQ
ncbi:Thymidylate kinase [Pseudozyma hubeiensis]|nr:Thymidylate kinase [Pseudozyma hubeiensis]